MVKKTRQEQGNETILFIMGRTRTRTIIIIIIRGKKAKLVKTWIMKKTKTRGAKQLMANKQTGNP